MRSLSEERDQLGEGPVWDDRTGRLAWIDVVGKRLSSCGPNGVGLEREALAENPGSFAFRQDGGRLVAFRRRIALFDAAGVEVASFAPPSADMERERFNDGKCDRRGRFWVGAMDRKLSDPLGGLYRIDPDLSAHRMDAGFALSNGIAWSPDDTRLYHCDTVPAVIHVHDYDLDTGTIANRRVFAEFDASMGRPDGCAMDVEGCLWVAAPGVGAVFRFDPRGRLDRHLPVPTSHPSSVAFGGEGLGVLFITSLRPAHGEDRLAGAVFATEVGVAGAPCARFGG